MILLNKSKYERQLESLNKWIANDHIGALDLVMRFGKTLIGAKALDLFRDKESIIIVTSEFAYNYWKHRIREYAEQELIQEDYISTGRTRIFTIHEIINGDLKLETDLLVIDELHKFTSDKRFRIFSKDIIKYDNILGLTGTYPRSVENFKRFSEVCPIVDVIQEQEAISKGWVSNFVEYNLGIDLPDNDKVMYEQYTKPIKETLALFRDTYKLFKLPNGTFMFPNDYKVIVSCFSGTPHNGKFIEPHKIREFVAKKKGWHESLDMSTEYGQERNAYWNPNSIYDRAQAFMKIVRDRDFLLINNKAKLATVIELFDKHTIPTICFNSSNDFATKIAEEINTICMNTNKITREIATVYHSSVRRPIVDETTNEYIKYKTGKRKGEVKTFGKDYLKKDAMEGMESGRYIFLSTVKSLDESLDLPILSQVITTAGGTDPTRYKQTTARGKSVNIYDPTKITKIINVYFKDYNSLITNDEQGVPIVIRSRDKQKLEQRQSSNKHSVLWVTSVDDIS